MSVVEENGSPVFDRSCGDSRRNSASAFGPMTEMTECALVTSTSDACSSASMCCSIQLKSGVACAFRQKIVRAFPIELRSENCAFRFQPIVKRRAAQRPDGFQLFARPPHCVMQPQRLDGAVGKMAAIRMEGREAADVDIEDIERRFAVDDPFRDQPAGATCVRNAGRIETGANEIAAELGRFAQNEITVKREAFRTVQKELDLGGLETRRTVNGVLHQDFELIPIFRQQLEFEALGNSLDIPRLCD